MVPLSLALVVALGVRSRGTDTGRNGGEPTGRSAVTQPGVCGLVSGQVTSGRVAGLREAGLRRLFTAHQACSWVPTSTLMTAWEPSSSDGQTARTTPVTCDGLDVFRVSGGPPHPIAAAHRSPGRNRARLHRTGPASVSVAAGHASHQTTRKADSPKASSSHGLATGPGSRARQPEPRMINPQGF